MIDCLDCGVIQGSKLSGLPYTIYTNEVPVLQEVLTNEEVYNTIGANFYEKLPVKHDVVNFVVTVYSRLNLVSTSRITQITSSSYWRYIIITRN